MEVATAIFFSTALALLVWQVGKYNKWRAVGKLLVVTVVLVSGAVGAYLAYLHFEEQSRFRERLAKERVLEAANARELAARQCIADDVGRMEQLVQSASRAIREDMSVEMAREALKEALRSEGRIVTPGDALTDLVVVNEVPTKCDSDFHFLIKLRARRVGTGTSVTHQLVWLKVSAKHPPVGYTAPDVGKDFDVIREVAANYSSREAKQRQDELQRRELDAARSAQILRSARLKSEMEAARAAEQAEAARWDSIDGPCAEGLTREERLRRLALTGTVRQVDQRTWVTETFKIAFYLSGDLSQCRRFSAPYDRP